MRLNLPKKVKDDVEVLDEAFVEKNFNAFQTDEFSFYFLRTGHIFIFFRGRLAKASETFEAFLEYLSEGDSANKGVFHLYDLGFDFSKVEDLCASVCSKVKTREEKEHAEELKRKAGGLLDVNEVQKRITAQVSKQNESGRVQRLNIMRKQRVKPLLLLIEDERLTQSFISTFLKSYCDVIVSDSVGDGLFEYMEHWPNLVFLDLNLPDGDGADVLQEIHVMDPDAYIVMVSANISQDRIEECLGLGAKGFLAKPVTANKDRMLLEINKYNKHNKAHPAY